MKVKLNMAVQLTQNWALSSESAHYTPQQTLLTAIGMWLIPPYFIGLSWRQ
jgi:hypothetical protein